MLDMQDFVLRHIYGDFLQYLSAQQIDSLLRETFTLLTSDKKVKEFDEIELEPQLMPHLAERIERKINQFKHQLVPSLKDKIRPLTAGSVRKGRPNSSYPAA